MSIVHEFDEVCSVSEYRGGGNDVFLERSHFGTGSVLTKMDCLFLKPVL